MARIRTVKPEFWSDERIGECSPTARLLFIASWNFADDHGGLDRSAKQLKAQAFPYDVIDCEPLIQELIGQRLLVEYESGGKKYLHISGFRKHQKVEKPAKPRIPLYEESLKSLGGLTEDSPRTHRLAAVSLLEGKSKNPPYPQTADSNGLDQDAWNTWKAYREKIRRPIKPAAIPASQQQLAAYGADQARIVNQVIRAGRTRLGPIRLSVADRERLSLEHRRQAEMDRAREHAQKIGCPLEPFPADSAETYATRVRGWELKNPAPAERGASHG
jgi:hypothetical protein